MIESTKMCKQAMANGRQVEERYIDFWKESDEVLEQSSSKNTCAFVFTKNHSNFSPYYF